MGINKLEVYQTSLNSQTCPTNNTPIPANSVRIHVPAESQDRPRASSESTDSCSADRASENKLCRSASKRPSERILAYSSYSRYRTLSKCDLGVASAKLSWGRHCLYPSTQKFPQLAM